MLKLLYNKCICGIAHDLFPEELLKAERERGRGDHANTDEIHMNTLMLNLAVDLGLADYHPHGDGSFFQHVNPTDTSRSARQFAEDMKNHTFGGRFVAANYQGKGAEPTYGASTRSFDLALEAQLPQPHPWESIGGGDGGVETSRLPARKQRVCLSSRSHIGMLPQMNGYCDPDAPRPPAAARKDKCEWWCENESAPWSERCRWQTRACSACPACKGAEVYSKHLEKGLDDW